ncbi:MAG: hypothetical protein GMKNLPBB_02799 [Myxococcota bacterium]|nr:hypothetical protein [Myxococcota bacterium]
MERVLLLNQSYQPLTVISWRRAITLQFLGKIEVIEEYQRQIRSVSTSIPAPAVVRLTEYVALRRRVVKFSRRNLYLRDQFTCQYCRLIFDAGDLTYDHVVPRRLGGKTEWSNVVTACRPCNSAKGGRTPEQAGMALHRPPARPHYDPRYEISMTHPRVPEVWLNYLPWQLRPPFFAQELERLAS